LLLSGTGADEDIVVSSARAYVSALNKMVGWLSVAQRSSSSDDPYKARRATVDSMDGAADKKAVAMK
jgi:2-isopropylmalate synthase